MLNPKSSKGFRVCVGRLLRSAPISPQEQVWDNEGGAAASGWTRHHLAFRPRVVLGRRG